MTRTLVIVAFFVTLLSHAALAQGKADGSALAVRKFERAPKLTKMVEGKVAEINDAKVVIENDYGAKKEIKLNTKTRFQLTEKKRVNRTEVKPGTFVKITFSETDLTAKKVQETTTKFRE